MPLALPDMLAPRRTALLIIDVQEDFGAPTGLYGRVGYGFSILGDGIAPGSIAGLYAQAGTSF